MPKSKTASTARWFLGLACSSIFTLAYFFAPLYAISAFLSLIFQLPSLNAAILFASPILISVVLPPVASPSLLKQLSVILDYFEYEQIIESKPIDARENLRNGQNYIIAAQPHGVLSMCAICSAVSAEEEFRGTIPTGVASALLLTPILKHVMGIFNLIPASKENLKKQFKRGGIEGTVVLYVGGMAELFLSSAEEEVLYLKNRKGFIKLALQEGVDVIPIYLFGNTTVLSVIKTGLLANLSRKVRDSCCPGLYYNVQTKYVLPLLASSFIDLFLGQMVPTNSSRREGKPCRGPRTLERHQLNARR